MAHESKPSKTAMLVSQAVYFKSRDSRLKNHCVEETSWLAGILIRKFHPLGGLWLRLLEQGWFRRLAEGFENLFLPGFMNHVVLRKWWIRETVFQLLRCPGYFINVGAGFDGLSLSLRKQGRTLACFEMDFPQTQHLKKSLIPSADLQFCGLNWDLPRQKLADGDPATLVILLEGVSMYLSAPEAQELLNKLSTLYPGPTYLVATAMEVDSKGVAHFAGGSPLINRWLQKVREPFAWGIAPSRLTGFLSPCGWTLEKVVQTSEVARDLHLPLRTAHGEYLFLARKERH